MVTSHNFIPLLLSYIVFADVEVGYRYIFQVVVGVCVFEGAALDQHKVIGYRCRTSASNGQYGYHNKDQLSHGCLVSRHLEMDSARPAAVRAAGHGDMKRFAAGMVYQTVAFTSPLFPL
jgi:hypothetical protein